MVSRVPAANRTVQREGKLIDIPCARCPYVTQIPRNNKGSADGGGDKTAIFGRRNNPGRAWEQTRPGGHLRFRRLDSRSGSPGGGGRTFTQGPGSPSVTGRDGDCAAPKRAVFIHNSLERQPTCGDRPRPRSRAYRGYASPCSMPASRTDRTSRGGTLKMHAMSQIQLKSLCGACRRMAFQGGRSLVD